MPRKSRSHSFVVDMPDGTQIIINALAKIGEVAGAHGFVDKEGIVCVDSTLPRIDYDETLLHELQHVVENYLVKKKKIKRGIAHAYITEGSMLLLYLVLACGVGKGIRAGDVLARLRDAT
jgi:hypothetical protein